MQNYQGLTESEVIESRARFGANVLKEPPRVSAWKLFFGKFKDPVILILIVATFISAVTGGLIESAGIFFAIALATGIGFLSEYKAGRAFDILNKAEDATPIKTIRDGKMTLCAKSDLVVGDVIFVETGDEIPADTEVLDAVDLRVDESKFTGEPEPVLKTADGEESDGTYPANVVLRGVQVQTGNGHLRITSVGNATEIGKTVQSATEITADETPLQKQLHKLSGLIAKVGFTLSIALCVILISRAFLVGTGLDFNQILKYLMISITLIVVVVPEGLPMSVTLSLAMSMRRMAKSNVLIRKLHACETIGATTVICTDKTGTLTMNQMNVVDIKFDDEKVFPEAFCVNATAELDDDLQTIGNPTEGALLRYLSRRNIDYHELRKRFEVIRQFPFSSQQKMMATYGRSEGNEACTHFKGAPEFLLGKSNRILTASGVCELSDSRRDALMADFKKEQDKGERTIGFAVKDGETSPADAEDLIFLGFAAIADPVRPDVPDAITECRNAGIEVKIVTGDTRATAVEIGHSIGLDTRTGGVIEGRDFEALSDGKCAESVPKLSVIARARPNDKMRLVKTLQSATHVVAVTGDGTNDAPALHHANVGIAMGKTGTAIAREAADIILLDDAFPSIVNAVLWGRSLYLNIQRFLVFQLSINVSAAGIALLGPFCGIEMPFTVIQMLWINLIMDTFAAMALASEPPTHAVMKNKPRSPSAFIITPAMAQLIFTNAILFIGVFFAATFILPHGEGANLRSNSLIFSGFVCLQFWNLLNVRLMGGDHSIFTTGVKSSLIFFVIAVGILVGQILITQFCGRFFAVAPLTFNDWIILILGSSFVLVFGEVYRWCKRLT